MRKAPVFGGGLLVSRHRKDSHSSVSRSPGFLGDGLFRDTPRIATIPAGCHVFSKKSTDAFGAGTRTPSGLIVTIGGTPPRPLCFQTVQNRVRVARAEHVRMVCHVLWLRALDGCLRAFSGIPACDPIVVVGTVTICDGMVHLRCIGQTSVMRRFAPVCVGARGLCVGPEEDYPMWILSALLRTVVCFRVCVWDSISNADGIAGGNALPRARARVKQAATLQFVTFRSRAAARGVVGRHGISWCSWLRWSAGMRALIRHGGESVISVMTVILGVRCLGIIGFSNMTLVLTKCHKCHIGGCSWCVWWCGCPDSTWCEKCLIGDDSWHVGRHVSVVS